MKFVKLFIASSIVDFETERIQIGAFVQKLNEQVFYQNICVKLFLCEDESTNCQSIYDRHIEECDLFVVLLDKKIGPYTQHEINVAYERGKSIRKKIIISKNKSSFCIFENELPSFNFYFYNENEFLQSTLTLLQKEIETCASDIPDSAPPTPQIDNKFKLKFPQEDAIEKAIINNIVRMFNDQFDGKLKIIEELEYLNSDAYISIPELESKNELSQILEKDLIKNIDSLWVFLKNNESQTEKIKEVIKKMDIQYALYPVFYNAYKNFELFLKLKLYGALVNYGLLEGFRYIVEDHLLIKETLVTGKRYVVKNLSSLCDEKKERTIRNVLNLYCYKKNKEQYIKALEQLDNSNFDYFGYNQYVVSDLQEYLPNRDFYEAVVDFVTSSLEKLQLCIYNIEENELNNEISVLLGTFYNNNLTIRNSDALYIYYWIGNLYYAKNLIDETEKFLCQVLRTYDNMLQNNPNDTETEIVLQATLELCEIYFKANSYNKLLNIIQTQLNLPLSKGNYQHETFKILLYIYQARAYYRISKKESSEKTYLLAKDALEKNNYKQNDMLLDIYIQLTYELVINSLYLQHLNIDEKLVDDVVDLYNRYLSANNKYELTGNYVNLLLAAKNNDWKVAHTIVQSIHENILEKNNYEYLDMVYLYAHILEESGEYEKAIKEYNFLVGRYVGDEDCAACLQNKARCYMFTDCDKNLQEAEKAFSAALNIYEGIDSSRENTCNIYDGLAYCYILQKKFQLAEECVKKAIDIGDYKNSNNLYSNFISSLLCQQKYKQARQIFHNECMIKCDISELKKQLKKDWNEMKTHGIKTTFFNLILI